MTPRFLLVGLGSELALRPLARALEERGLRAHVIDLADGPADRASAPADDGPLVLVTSQHSFMTGDVYDEFYGTRSHYRSPQALRAAVGADLMVYVPHDLMEPVLASERPLLQLFDLYAAPDEDSWWAHAHVRTVVTGWVGTAGPHDPRVADAPLERGVLFVTFVRWLAERGGGSFLLRSLERTLETGLAVKLPAWPGLDDMATALDRAGVRLVDASLASSAIASHTPLVVTNGASSVLAEATLAGHRPVCVLHPAADAWSTATLATVDAIVCRDEDFRHRSAEAGRIRAAAPPFDLDGFLDAIGEGLRGG